MTVLSVSVDSKNDIFSWSGDWRRMDGEEGTVGGVLSDFVETAQELPHLSV
jgi:hypothetical protein